MKTRIPDVKTRYALLLSLMLGLAVAGPALAQSPQCNVTLSSILPSNQAVLKANCGSSNMTSITWARDAGTTSVVTFGPFTFPATLADLNFTTLLTSGTHSYTASGLANTTVVPAGQAAVVTLSQPILTVAVSPGGSVTSNPLSTSTPIGISSCKNTTGICAAGFDTGTTVVLTPTAEANNTFAGWGGDCSGAGNCTVSMTTLRTVAANFSSVPTYALNVTSSGGVVAGNGISCPGTCSVNLTSGTSVSLTATPTGSNIFNGWSGGSCSGPGTCSFSIGTSAASVVASFGAIPIYTLTVTASAGGTVTGNGINCPGTCSSNLTSGTLVSLTASPSSTNVFNGWSGACTNGTGTCTFNITGPATVGANFGAAATYALTVTSPTGGTITGSAGGQSIGCPGTCTASGLSNGALVSLSAAAASGYTFGGWSGSCSGTSTCSFFIASAGASVTANFTASTGGGTASCGEGQGDYNLSSIIEGALWPVTQPGFTASGDSGTAIEFKADRVNYPLGILIHIVDQGSQPSNKEFTINACPHNFTPLQATCSTAAGGTGTLVLRFGQGSVTALNGDCPLQPNQTYYLNVREWKASSGTSPRGTVATQLWWSRRTDQ